MSAVLKKRFKEGAYNNIKDPNLLAAMLTNDVNSVYRDEHFHVEYNPGMSKELNGDIDDVPRMVEEKLNKERSKNFGFKKVEILNGNIGYLEISSFSRLNQHSKETATAALKLLSNTRAIIIDLRYGMGGSPEMMNHIMSHFFKERIHVADVSIRSEKVLVSYYTSPDTTAGRLTEIPLYILTSYKTFSAAEGLSYELQNLKRAIIVGEKTRGGAHTVKYRALSNGFVVDLPFGRVTCPFTNSNWEHKGVQPDVEVNSDLALEKAESLIIEKLLTSTKDSVEIKSILWQKDLLFSKNYLSFFADDDLKNYAGTYGAFKIESLGTALYYQKTGRARFVLQPLSTTLMKVKGNDTFRVEFQKDGSGKAKQLITYYEDGRVEIAVKTAEP